MTMAEIKLKINGQQYQAEVDASMPLLWALRDVIGLIGTKFGCGIGQCGACTVLLNGKAIRSCSVAAKACEGKSIETIENVEGGPFHGLLLAWIDEQVPQCGYCQSGQIMNAIGLLNNKRHPTEDEILSAMQGNICRCGTYPRILKAIKSYVSSDTKSA